MEGQTPGRRPTIRDVASLAGVSIKTVSRVMNSEPGVKPSTAGRVRGAIEDLGFRRNELARLLRTGSADVLAPCPGCESLRRQCSELAGEVGFLAGVLTELRDSDHPHGSYARDRARAALDGLHAGPETAGGTG